MDLSLDGPKGPQEQRADFVVKQCTGNQMNFDESYCLRFWGDDDMTSLPPKGEGKLVMTSDFITIFGQLKYCIIT